MAVTTAHGEPTLMPQRKLVVGALGLFALVIGVSLLNHFVLGPADRIDMPTSAILTGLVPLVIAYFAPPAAHEGVQS